MTYISRKRLFPFKNTEVLMRVNNGDWQLISIEEVMISHINMLRNLTTNPHEDVKKPNIHDAN